ncbi:MAG: ArnT family glycosyltransferase [Parvularculaceae bacterium]
MTATPYGFALMRRHWAPLLVCALFCCALALYWRGIGPGDAERYLDAALHWREGPWLGDSHWSLRHLFVLPMTASFLVFGVSETAAIIPNVVYAALTIVVTWHFARRALGEREAFIAASLVATSAFFVARPVGLEVYGAEAFFAILAMWLFIVAEVSKARARWLIAAGLVAGLATTVREPSIYLMGVFGLAILARRRDVWRSLFFVGAGFAAVIAVELAVYAIAAGDPLYRYKTDLNHRAIGVDVTMTAEEASLPSRLKRMAAYLISYPMTTPLLALAGVAIAYLARTKALRAYPGLAALKIVAAAALFSAIIVPLAFNLSLPRYYPLLTYGCILVIAVAVAVLWSRGRPRAAIAAGLGVIAVNAAIADFISYDEYAEARGLARIAAAFPEPVSADPQTAHRARYQLRLKGLSGAEASAKIINARAPEPGALFLMSSQARRNNPAYDRRWCVIEALAPRRTGWTHALIRQTGLARLLGRQMEDIVAPPAPILLIRMLERPAQQDPASGRACLGEQPA